MALISTFLQEGSGSGDSDASEVQALQVIHANLIDSEAAHLIDSVQITTARKSPGAAAAAAAAPATTTAARPTINKKSGIVSGVVAK